jgi:hypothetical protein
VEEEEEEEEAMRARLALQKPEPLGNPASGASNHSCEQKFFPVLTKVHTPSCESPRGQRPVRGAVRAPSP